MRTRLLAAAVVFLALSGCKPSPPPVYTDAVTVSKLARIPVPPSATNIHCRDDRDDDSWPSIPGPDYAIWGRFDIPAADLPLVLAQMPKEVKVKPGTEHSDFTNDDVPEAWWQPDQLRVPQAVGWMMPSFSVKLLFGESGPDGMLTVYFFNFKL